MKAVFYKTTRENYGAHDWDGKGSCPQRWKVKNGLSTMIIVENVDVDLALNKEYWDGLEDRLSSSDDYFEVSVYFGELVDDADWDEWLARNTDTWECPTYLNLLTLVGRAEKPIIGYNFPEFDKSVHYYGIGEDGNWGPTHVAYRYADGSGEITHKELFHPEAA